MDQTIVNWMLTGFGSLIVKSEDGWGSADAGNVNPGVGNIPKTKVLAHDIRANLFVDSQWNSKGYLSLPSVYPTTSVFDSTTTIALGQVTNREYEDDLFYAMRENELFKAAGQLCCSGRVIPLVGQHDNHHPIPRPARQSSDTSTPKERWCYLAQT